MPLSDSDVQNLIVLEVGDSDSGVLATNMALIWASYADKAQIAPRLQELYSKRRAIDVVVGAARKNVDFVTSALSVRQSQELERLAELRTETVTEIARVERQARTARAVTVAPLTSTAPESPPSFRTLPDANSSRYRGDPYKILRRRVS